jgi:hypothetical protein
MTIPFAGQFVVWMVVMSMMIEDCVVVGVGVFSSGEDPRESQRARTRDYRNRPSFFGQFLCF